MPMTVVISRKTTKEMDRVFSTHGITQVIVSDNCTNFSSQAFTDYMTLTI